MGREGTPWGKTLRPRPPKEASVYAGHRQEAYRKMRAAEELAYRALARGFDAAVSIGLYRDAEIMLEQIEWWDGER